MMGIAEADEPTDFRFLIASAPILYRVSASQIIVLKRPQ